MVKPKSLLQVQLIQNISKTTNISFADVRKVLEAYENEARTGMMNNCKVPLPGGMGYLYLTITTTKSRTAHLELTDTQAVIQPQLKTVATFSAPWKRSLQLNENAKDLIRTLISKKEENRKWKIKKKMLLDKESGVKK